MAVAIAVYALLAIETVAKSPACWADLFVGPWFSIENSGCGRARI
jgi:hypothetical protein